MKIHRYKMERILCEFIHAAAQQVIGSKLPMHWYGTWNVLGLYLRHSYYSPFLEIAETAKQSRKENIDRLVNRPYPLNSGPV